MTVAEMRERVTAREYMGWQVFHSRKAQKQELAMMQARSKS